MSRTNKTAAVLNLIHGSALSDDSENRKSGGKPADDEEKKHRVVKNPVVLEMESEFESEEEERPLGLKGGIINAAYLLVNEKLADVVQRFNACSCDSCLKEISAKVMDELPPMFIKMDGGDSVKKLEQLMDENRADVLKTLTRIVLPYRTKNHGK